jgi:aspartate aminotransferase-like enzyme
MRETHEFGLSEVERRQWELGTRVRALLAGSGFPSVAAPGYEAPGVVVSYTDDPLIQNGKRFAEVGLQTAAGVPLMCDEPADFRTFRIGLFGLDKWRDVDAAVGNLERALATVAPVGTP